MIVSNSELLKSFSRYLKLEKGASDNTIDGYLHDVVKLFQYVSPESKPTIDQLVNADITQFICQLQDIGIQPRSQARILSGLNSFYTFLRLEGFTEENPMELIEGPKLGRKLPEVLTVEEIDLLIDSFDMSLPESQRNRAIIETMYDCGLRVSELVGLRISQIYFKDEYIIVEGKGSKQRLIPISQSALHEIELYQKDRCHITPKKGDEDILFLNRRGGRLSPGHDILYHQKTMRSLRHTKKHQPPHPTPQLRYPPARRRSQPASHTTNAGTRKHHHHRDICTSR